MLPQTVSLYKAAARAVIAGGLVLGAAAGAVMLFESTAQPAAAQESTFNDAQKKAIGDIIKDYLLANPEVLVDVQAALEAKMEKQQSEKLRSFVEKNGKDIYRSATAPVAGNPDGDITVVEFFDYNCGYCKRGLPEVVKLLEKDSKVRLVLRELPILSKASEEASRVTLAAGKQGKYWEVHKALLSNRGQNNEASSLKIAAGLGLDMEKLQADMKSTEVSEEIARAEALAKQMGINGTPHFLVGDRAIPGAPDDLHDQLENLVTDMRKKGCTYC